MPPDDTEGSPPLTSAQLTEIVGRWDACEGSLTQRATDPEEDTDIEYRGVEGKWTLARFHDTDMRNVSAWMEAFLHAREDVHALLTEIRRLEILLTRAWAQVR